MPTTKKHEEPEGPRRKRQPRDPSPDREAHEPTAIDEEKHAGVEEERGEPALPPPRH